MNIQHSEMRKAYELNKRNLFKNDSTKYLSVNIDLIGNKSILDHLRMHPIVYYSTLSIMNFVEPDNISIKYKGDVCDLLKLADSLYKLKLNLKKHESKLKLNSLKKYFAFTKKSLDSLASIMKCSIEAIDSNDSIIVNNKLNNFKKFKKDFLGGGYNTSNLEIQPTMKYEYDYIEKFGKAYDIYLNPDDLKKDIFFEEGKFYFSNSDSNNDDIFNENYHKSSIDFKNLITELSDNVPDDYYNIVLKGFADNKRLEGRELPEKFIDDFNSFVLYNFKEDNGIFFKLKDGGKYNNDELPNLRARLLQLNIINMLEDFDNLQIDEITHIIQGKVINKLDPKKRKVSLRLYIRWKEAEEFLEKKYGINKN